MKKRHPKVVALISVTVGIVVGTGAGVAVWLSIANDSRLPSEAKATDEGPQPGKPVLYTWPKHKERINKVLEGFHDLHHDFDKIVFDMEELPIEEAGDDPDSAEPGQGESRDPNGTSAPKTLKEQ